MYLPAYVLDESVVYRLAPGARLRHEGVGGSRTIQINRLGYRGAEPDLSPGRTRIVVYGDSFVFGGFSDLRDTFVARLEQALHAAGRPDVQVLNAGVVGYGPDQEVLRLESEFQAFAPSVVILAVFTGNDFGDLLRNSLFRLEGGRLVENHSEIHPKVRASYADRQRLFRSGSLLSHSMLFRLVAKAWWVARREDPDRSGEDHRDARPVWDAAWVSRMIALRRREYHREVEKGDRRERLGPDTEDADLRFAAGSPSARYKRDLLEAVLARGHDFLAARGVPLLLLVIPASADVCGHLDGIEPTAFPDAGPAARSSAVVGMAERHGIPVVDLYPAFSGPRCDRLYLPFPDLHWSPAGEQLAAQRVAERLEAGLLAAPPPQGHAASLPAAREALHSRLLPAAAGSRALGDR